MRLGKESLSRLRLGEESVDSVRLDDARKVKVSSGQIRPS